MTTKRQLADALNKAVGQHPKKRNPYRNTCRPSTTDFNSIESFYQMLIGWGYVANVVNGELVIDGWQAIREALRQRIEARKAELIKHIEGLPK